MRDIILAIHRNDQGASDYASILTLEYSEEMGYWTGVCLELGTATFSDTLGEVQQELREAIELQLNEMDRLTNVRGFLEENHVRMATISPAAIPPSSGFVVVPGLR